MSLTGSPSLHEEEAARENLPFFLSFPKPKCFGDKFLQRILWDYLPVSYPHHQNKSTKSCSKWCNAVKNIAPDRTEVFSVQDLGTFGIEKNCWK